ncbi:hypothetical protein [Streptomyces sp. bgisy027]|uniref:hypothetical protein n=1 Tax=Streptomyces sp. bgisy027 TaxID=3413770 RepID=UPI003D75C66A
MTTPTGSSPEADTTRELAAGTYLDDGFRGAVIEELYEHPERTVAPSVGFDAVPVLVHALRARRIQSAWAWIVIALWAVGFLVAGAFFAYYLAPAVLLAISAVLASERNDPVPRRLGSQDRPPRGARRVLSASLSVLGRVMFAGYLGLAVANITSPGLMPPGGDALSSWVALGVPLGMTLCAVGHRAQVNRTLSGVLSPQLFGDGHGAHAALASAPRLRATAGLIAREQHAPLVGYGPNSPFLGFGSPYKPWTAALELASRPGGSPRPLSNRDLLDGITARAEQLRRQQATSPRHPLARLVVDEYVFLPVEGLQRRDAWPHGTEAFDSHRTAAVEEGADRRRHYLSIQIPGETQDCVATVFIRVHTHGGMLAVEYLPHVLYPVRPDFRAVDRGTVGQRRFPASWWLQTPAFAARSVSQLLGHSTSWYRAWSGHRQHESPDGPHMSVRELAAEKRTPLLQAMDVHRHLQAVQENVVSGVLSVLREHGYTTARSEGQISQVTDGGVSIGSMSGGAVATGTNYPIRPAEAGPGSPGPTTNPDDDSWRRS